jgi:hypothetical protein
LKIPKKIKIGRRWYTIEVVEKMPTTGHMGEIDYPPNQHIRVGLRSNRTGKSFKQEEVADTFWHEVVHAILHDMDSRLYRNETFVGAFAARLTKAINSARF